MTILEDIQNSAVDATSDLATLLRKCKLLAARLGSQPLEDWVIWESNGYPDQVPVPDYRIWSLEVFGHFAGPFGSGIRNAPIPITVLKFISTEIKQAYQRYECRESVASIEATVGRVKGNVQVSTGGLAVAIGTKLYQNQNCVQAWAEFGTVHLVELLNSVRNRILDFAVAVWKEAPNAGETGSGASKNLEVKKVTQIFNTTVYGGSANLVGTATASSVAFNIGASDFSALERVLVENGVAQKDIRGEEGDVEGRGRGRWERKGTLLTSWTNVWSISSKPQTSIFRVGAQPRRLRRQNLPPACTPMPLLSWAASHVGSRF